MSLDILLLIATIVVAVAAVFASLLQAVLDRSSGSTGAGQGPRKVDPRRLARAVPPPVRIESSGAPKLVEASTPKPIDASAPIPVEPAAPIPVEPAAPIPVEPLAPIPAAPEAPLSAAPEPAAPEPALPAARETVLVTPPPAPVQSASIEADDVSAAAFPAPAAPPERQPATVAAASLSMVSATAPATWRPDEAKTPDRPVDPELAYRIGVAGVQRPSRPAVIVVAGAEPRTVSMPSTVATEAWPAPPHRRRRAAFRVAAVAAALAWVMTAIVVLPDVTQQGGVLGETGRPQVSGNGSVVAVDTPGPSSVVGTPAPSPTPAATATQAPTAKPTRSPRPSRIPLPTAAFTCTTNALTLSCAASVTDPAASYLWDFSEGTAVSGAQASHLFATAGQYLVMLSVTNAWGSSTSSMPFKIG